MIRSSIFAGLVFLLSACSKDVNEPPSQLPYSFFNTPVVNTGYYAYDLNGTLINVIGLPNTLREATIGGVQYSMLTFPNPSWHGIFNQSQWTISLNPAFEGRTGRVWLVKATSSEGTSPFISENGRIYQNMGEPFVVWEGTYEGQGLLSVPTPVNEDADYRLYVEIEGKLIYDNLAVRQFSTY
jgi:hypothetical protein